MSKAILLFSEGLDSLLAGLLLKEQNIKVIPVKFITPFFGWKYKKNPEIFYQKLKNYRFEDGVIYDITEEFIEILKHPKYGFGNVANPCIDCKILMLKKAKDLMQEFQADFVATGEVLGQRPMSQNKQALELIEKESGLTGLLLRPLSAKLLSPTIPEKQNLVKRENLLDIRGRQRKIQLELAKKFNLQEIPTPAGGCLLTDPQIGGRVLRILKEKRSFNYKTCELTVMGRHFMEEGLWIVLGRDQQENERIKEIAKNLFPLYTLSVSSPLAAVIEGNPSLDYIKTLLLRYSPKAKKILEKGEKVECIKL